MVLAVLPHVAASAGRLAGLAGPAPGAGCWLGISFLLRVAAHPPVG